MLMEVETVRKNKRPSIWIQFQWMLERRV